jgi:membrane associated rhomboid family serine protease
MIPIGDDNVPGAPFPIVNVFLIVINVIVFIFEAMLDPNSLEIFINHWAVTPTQILAGQQWITLITGMFLHGSWLHLIGNMLFLAIFGDNIEGVIGHFPYLIFYLVGGLIAAFTHIFFNATSNVPSLGASGAIAAVMGAYIVMFPRSKVRAFILLGFLGFVTRVSAIVFLGVWFVMQLFTGVTSLGVNTAQTSGVAVWAHVGGFVFGLIVGLFLRNRATRVTSRYYSWR